MSVIFLNSIQETRIGIWIILSVLTKAFYSKFVKDKVLLFSLLLSFPGSLIEEVLSMFLLNWFKLMNYSEIIVSRFLSALLPLQNFSMMSDYNTKLLFLSYLFQFQRTKLDRSSRPWVTLLNTRSPCKFVNSVKQPAWK